MLHILPHPIKGLMAITIYAVNTIVLATPVILLALIKFIVPIHWVVISIDKVLTAIAYIWIAVNLFNTQLFCKIKWDTRGLEKLAPAGWYLVVANHQSWVDILVLQTIFNRRIPMLKFFLKKELIWIPFLGLAWWALDFPFMKRYTKKEIEKNPALKGKDLEATRKACERFKHAPVSIINFAEGTRFTPEKKSRQNSPLTHLLAPKAGGIAFVLGSMGDHLHTLIDVTIVYPEGVPSFWQFISGQVHHIVIDLDVLPITPELKGDYFNNPADKEIFFSWLNRLWQKKDKKITTIKKELHPGQ
jgi:1-acyl-sn-glycerol-3-phosphate acyltransferase